MAQASGSDLFAPPLPGPLTGYGITAVADFNNDGILDVAGTKYNSRRVAMALGLGAGLFSAPLILPTQSLTFAVATGDLDADGFADIVVSTLDRNVIILFGHGDGTFAPEVVVPIASFSGRMPTVGDLNGDGIDDIVVGHRSTVLSVLLSNGDGSFQPVQAEPPGVSRPFKAVIGDFNGDGLPDLAVGSDGQNAVSILEGTGGGSFVLARILKTTGGTTALVIGDFDGDGILDLAAPSRYPAHVAILTGNGDGTFAPEMTTSSAGLPWGLAAGDFNLDGRLDLAVANYGSDDFISLLLGSGTGNFTPTTTENPATQFQHVISADIDNDGRIDLISSSLLGFGTTTILLNQAMFAGVCEDLDRDEYGFPPDPACPGGAAPDCDDLDSAISPGVTEICDGIDNNCNLLIDEGFDRDRDGVTTCQGDCDDASPQVFPGTADVCDGVDNNCDGLVDENPDALSSCTDGYPCTLETCTNAGRCQVDKTGCLGQDLALTLFPAPVLPLDRYALSSRSGDLNGDLIPDLVIAVYQPAYPPLGAEIVVYLGLPDGFTVAERLPIENLPASMVLADLNSDGNLDLILTDVSTNEIVVRPGHGDGTFAAESRYAAGLGPYTLAAEDLNADGYVDLAVGTILSRETLILLGDGTGNLRQLTSFRGSYSITADFTGDGIPDLASLGYNPPRLLILPNTGHGTFGDEVSHSLSTHLSGAKVADFNADGILDLAGRSTDGLLVLLGQPDGTFVEVETEIDMGVTGRTLVADLNADGDLDLAIVVGDGIAIFLGGGDGTFLPLGLTPAGIDSAGIFAWDMDNDGSLDILTVNASPGDISVLKGNGDGTFRFHPHVPVGDSPRGLLARDLNGDGHLDLAVTIAGLNAITGVASKVSISLGKGDGCFSAPTQLAAGINPGAIVAGDFNSDGALDLAVANEGWRHSDIQGDISIYFGKGDGSFAQEKVFLAGDHPVELAVGDFNRDAEQDLVVAYARRIGHFKTLQHNGDGTFLERTHRGGSTSSSGMVVADFDGDGILDVAISDIVFSVNAPTIYLSRGNGDGSFQPPTYHKVGDAPSSFRASDFNNDGIQDLATVELGGTAMISLGRGDGTFEVAREFESHLGNNLALEVMDLNNDNLMDLITIGAYSRLAVYFGAGDGTVSPPLIFDSGSGSRAVKLGDFDGDTIPDAAVISTSTGSVTLLLHNNQPTPCLTTPPSRRVHAQCRTMPQSLSLQSQARMFSLQITLTDGDTGDYLDPGLLSPMFISGYNSPERGPVRLRTPRAGPGCRRSLDDGIWESSSQRRLKAEEPALLQFNTPSDDTCETMDGDRQDIIKLLSYLPNRDQVELCFQGNYPGYDEPVACCAALTIASRYR